MRKKVSGQATEFFIPDSGFDDAALLDDESISNAEDDVVDDEGNTDVTGLLDAVSAVAGLLL